VEVGGGGFDAFSGDGYLVEIEGVMGWVRMSGTGSRLIRLGMGKIVPLSQEEVRDAR